MTALMTAAFVLGFLLIAAGAWLAWRPAGLLVAGVSLVAISYLYARGSWLAQPPPPQ
jgi:hypothetical protein